MGTTPNGPNVSKAILITGCSSGIGKATALRLARGQETHGWKVWATARNRDAIQDLEEAGCRTIALDVDHEGSMVRAVEEVERVEGAVGVLVNNAGYAQPGAIEAVPMDRVRKQFETNVFGLIRMTQLVLPRMREQRWGRIINLSSMGGRLTFPGLGYYHATKYAVEALSDALRFELRGFGIHVVIVEPGFIHSGFGDVGIAKMMEGNGGLDVYDGFHSSLVRGTKEFYEKGIMARMAGTPEDVAATVERAIRRERPRPRYTVTTSATVLLAQRKWLGDRAWDAMMRSNFPSPGESQGGPSQSQ